MSEDELPPHLRGMGVSEGQNGGFVCRHGRSLGICATCAPEAEKRFAELKAAMWQRNAEEPRGSL